MSHYATHYTTPMFLARYYSTLEGYASGANVEHGSTPHNRGYGASQQAVLDDEQAGCFHSHHELVYRQVDRVFVVYRGRGSTSVVGVLWACWILERLGCLTLS